MYLSQENHSILNVISNSAMNKISHSNLSKDTVYQQTVLDVRNNFSAYEPGQLSALIAVLIMRLAEIKLTGTASEIRPQPQQGVYQHHPVPGPPTYRAPQQLQQQQQYYGNNYPIQQSKAKKSQGPQMTMQPTIPPVAATLPPEVLKVLNDLMDKNQLQDPQSEADIQEEVVDHEDALIKDQMHEYLQENNIHLSPEQYRAAYDGIQSAVSSSLSDTVDEAISSVL